MLEIDGLHVRYGGIHALKGISLNVTEKKLPRFSGPMEPARVPRSGPSLELFRPKYSRSLKKSAAKGLQSLSSNRMRTRP